MREAEIKDKNSYIARKEGEINDLKKQIDIEKKEGEKATSRVDTMEVNYRAKLKEMSDILAREKEKTTNLTQKFW